jgi:hypothetical protein
VKHADANKVIRGGLLAMQPTRYQYLVGKLTGADKVIDVVQPKGEELGGGNIVTGESSEMSKKRAETGTIGGGGGFGTGKPLSGEELYGQTMGQTGQQIQDIIRRRQGYLDAADPTSTYVRQSANRQVRQARAEAGQAGRTTRGEEAQIRRQAEADIGAQLYENRLRSLGAYQNTISNVARNLATIELGNQSIATGSQMPAPPRGGGLVDGLTVICTELHRQGYLSDEIIEKDAEFGRTIRVESPEVYQGYRLLADPVVVRMQKSKVFTAIVAKVALRTTTGKGECLSDAGTQTSKSSLGSSGIMPSKASQGSYGTKQKYQKIVGNMGELASSSGIAPRKRSTEGESGIGTGVSGYRK